MEGFNLNSISAAEKIESTNLFYSLKPVDCKIGAQVAKGLLTKSNLPTSVLAQIWELSDMDKDGCLSLEEFIIAKHLMEVAFRSIPLPKCLPKDLKDSAKSLNNPLAFLSAPPFAFSPASSGANTLPRVLPDTGTNKLEHLPKSDSIESLAKAWVLENKTQLLARFNSIPSVRLNGKVSGKDAREILTSSGLSNDVLAKIWNMSDTDRDGQLSLDEFMNAVSLTETHKRVHSQRLPDGRDSCSNPETQVGGTRLAAVHATNDKPRSFFGREDESEIVSEFIEIQRKNVQKILNSIPEQQQQEEQKLQQYRQQQQQQYQQYQQQQQQQQHVGTGVALEGCSRNSDNNEQFTMRLREVERSLIDEASHVSSNLEQLKLYGDKLSKNLVETTIGGANISALQSKPDHVANYSTNSALLDLLFDNNPPPAAPEKTRADNNKSTVHENVPKKHEEIFDPFSLFKQTHKLEAEALAISEGSGSFDPFVPQELSASVKNKKYGSLERSISLEAPGFCDGERLNVTKAQSAFLSCESKAVTTSEQLLGINESCNNFAFTTKPIAIPRPKNHKNKKETKKPANTAAAKPDLVRVEFGRPKVAKTANPPLAAFSSKHSAPSVSQSPTMVRPPPPKGDLIRRMNVKKDADKKVCSDSLTHAFESETPSMGAHQVSTEDPVNSLLSSSYLTTGDAFTVQPAVSNDLASFGIFGVDFSGAKNGSEVSGGFFADSKQSGNLGSSYSLIKHTQTSDKRSLESPSERTNVPKDLFGEDRLSQVMGIDFFSSEQLFSESTSRDPVNKNTPRDAFCDNTPKGVTEQSGFAMINPIVGYSVPSETENFATCCENLPRHTATGDATHDVAAGMPMEGDDGAETKHNDKKPLELDPPMKTVAATGFKSKETQFSFAPGDELLVTFEYGDFYYSEIDGIGDWFPKFFTTVVSAEIEEEYNHDPAFAQVNSFDLSKLRIALYDNEAEEAEDIEFKEGDLLFVSESLGSWFRGYGNGKEGIFPENYVTQKVRLNTNEFCSVKQEFIPRCGFELALRSGDSVRLLHRNSSGWCIGCVEGSCNIGCFPAVSISGFDQKTFNQQSDHPQPVPSPESVSSGPSSQSVVSIEATCANVNMTENYYENDDSNELSHTYSNTYLELSKNDCEKKLFRATTMPDNKKDLAMLRELVTELFETESKYLSDLKFATEAFYIPFRKSGLLNEEELDKLFLNWNTLIQTSETIICIVKTHIPSFNGFHLSGGLDNVISGLDNVISDLPSILRPYVEYCGKSISSIRLYEELKKNPSIQMLENNCLLRSKISPAFSLGSYLIKPIQRLTKLKLLSSQILKHFPHFSPSLPSIETAIRKLTCLCSEANEAARDTENEELRAWLEPKILNTPAVCHEKRADKDQQWKFGCKRLLLHGVLKLTRRQKEVMCFLYNDVFLICTCPANLVNKKIPCNDFPDKCLIPYKQPMDLKTITVKKHTDKAGSNFLRVVSKKNRVDLTAKTPEKLDRWVNEISDAVFLLMSADFIKRETHNQQ